MPELPEVETVVRDLRPLLAGRTITGARHSKHKLRRPWLAKWNATVTGSHIEGVRRRGKWILVDVAKNLSPQPPPLRREGELCADSTPVNRKCNEPVLTPPPFLGEGVGGRGSSPTLRVHLGMSGQFTVVDASTPEADHVHVVFALDNETELRLRDPRRFGAAEFFPDRDALEAEMNAELGPEPFGLDAEYFRDAVRGTSRNLKAILLDQSIVAGVGNIYADEALFRANLHPGRAGKRVTFAECDALRAAIEAVLTKAIESRGSTIRDYVGGSGLRGGFQNEHAVYGRTNEPCSVCESPIKCARYAGRASHFCPVCQSTKSKVGGKSKVIKSKVVKSKT